MWADQWVWTKADELVARWVVPWVAEKAVDWVAVLVDQRVA